MRTDNAVNRSCLKGFCCGPEYILYNSLLNLNIAKWMRATAFTDNLLIAVKAATVAEVGHFTNMEIIEIKNSPRKQIIFQGPKNQKLC